MSFQQPSSSKHENVVLGMAAAIGAHLMFSIMVMLAKLLSANHSVIEIAFYRNIIGTLPFLFVIFALGRRDIVKLESKPGLVGVRALIGTASLIVTFYAYSLMPLADTTALMFTASLYIPILAIIFLKETVGPYRWTAILIGFAGVIVMVRPTGDVYLLGVSVALAAALMHATLQTILRYLAGFEKPETIAFYFLALGAGITGLAMPFVATMPTLAELPLLIGIGLSGATAQWLLSLAYRNAPAAVVTVFNYTSIIWATMFGWMIFNDWPMPAVFIGAAIVITSNIFIVWRESRLARKPATITPVK